jgi:hypothetical protein
MFNLSNHDIITYLNTVILILVLSVIYIIGFVSIIITVFVSLTRILSLDAAIWMGYFCEGIISLVFF